MGKKNKRKTKKKSAGDSLKRYSTTESVLNKNDAALEALQKAVEDSPTDIEAVLSLAEYFFDNGSEDKIDNVLKPVKSLYPFDDEWLTCRFERLLAASCLYRKKYIEAEEIARHVIAYHPEALDFYYILTCLEAAMGEYQAAVETGKTFLAVFKKQKRNIKNIPELSYTGDRLSRFCNVLGTAYMESGRFADAESFFGQAVMADPGNHQSYLNLSKSYRYRGQSEHSLEVISAGLARCRQVHELRMLSECFRKKAAISACMMVKNEEELLAGSLESVRNWVDEIIVIDTGSTDRTVEIAEAYGAKVYHQPWADDFSFHRNYSIEKATGDWILIIDADERIVAEDVPLLLDVINAGECAVISVEVLNVYGENESKVTFLNSNRIFRRDLNLKYEGIVHNRLVIPDGTRILRTKARLKHLGYDLSEAKMKKKFDRSRALLEKQLEENPDNTFALFNYAQLLLGEGRKNWQEYSPKIIEAASRAVELTGPDNKKKRSTYLMCLHQVALANFYIGEYEKALEFCQKALRAKPDYLDPLMLLGHVYNHKRESELSDKYYQEYLEIQKTYDGVSDTDTLILFHPASLAEANYGIAANAELKNDLERAKEYYLKVYELNSRFHDINSQLGRIYLAEKDYDKAEKYFLDQIEYISVNVASALGMAYISLTRKNDDQFIQYHQMALGLDFISENMTLLIKLGRLYLNSGKLTEAADLFEIARRFAGDDITAEILLADTYFNLSRYLDAIPIYELVLSKNNDVPEVINNLGNCYYQLGNFTEAEKYYVHTLESSGFPAITYRNYGLALVRLDKAQEAIASFENYLKLEPNHDDILQLLGDLYSKTGDYSSAIRYFEQFIVKYPDNSRAIFAISECYLNMGHRDSAAVGYRRVVELDPQFTPAQKRLEEIMYPVSRR